MLPTRYTRAHVGAIGQYRCSEPSQTVSPSDRGGYRRKTSKITPNPSQDRSNGSVALPASRRVLHRNCPNSASLGLWEAPSFTTGRRSPTVAVQIPVSPVLPLPARVSHESPPAGSSRGHPNKLGVQRLLCRMLLGSFRVHGGRGLDEHRVDGTYHGCTLPRTNSTVG